MGTIIGYFGIEIGSDALFERLLWPTRYYNTWSPKSLLGFTFLTPMGGPLLRPAVRILDGFIHARLFLGKGRGDMLGTAFFSDLNQNCIIHTPKGTKDIDSPSEYKMRNNLWVRVLRLVKVGVTSKSATDVEVAARATKEVSAKRIVYHLSLEPNTSSKTEKSKFLSVSGDVGKPCLRNLIGVICSELFAIGTGVFVAVKYHSTYAILFFLPFLLKAISILFPVRRRSLQHPDAKAAKDSGPSSIEHAEDIDSLQGTRVYELARVHDNDDFMLIEGPSSLLHQFFHHYGHPSRNHPGALTSDRNREVISILLVGASALLFPVSLLLNVWAEPRIQWIWLG